MMLLVRPCQIGIGELPADAGDLARFALPAHPGGIAESIGGNVLEKRLVAGTLGVVMADSKQSDEARFLPAPEHRFVAVEEHRQLTARNRRVVAVSKPGGVELRFPGFEAACHRHVHLAHAGSITLDPADVRCLGSFRQRRGQMRPGAHVDPLARDVPEHPFPTRQDALELARAARDRLSAQGSAQGFALDPAAAVMLTHLLAQHDPDAQRRREVQRHAQPPQLRVDAKMGRFSV